MPGSSPRVRGKLSPARVYIAFDGLIPACAGKTPFQIGPIDAEKAHPRVCGENATSGLVAYLPGGSSPRVRGKQGRDGLSPDRIRLIPACAGKTYRQ